MMLSGSVDIKVKFELPRVDGILQFFASLNSSPERCYIECQSPVGSTCPNSPALSQRDFFSRHLEYRPKMMGAASIVHYMCIFYCVER